ncbi:MAG: N-acyl-D-amino-acid deacylase [uncultured Chloroflexi bacterium]|uniref:N-acyl-D-amino-acid deacylase n=1 Tax=uncultured Chloroflexota bacterium TaxID=166587 RepID=A0A6J4HFW9_9CHLR|nr:MAG: N-acyl-D-amino-acid deacylase [uncultured Chloroflexota bacterium]
MMATTRARLDVLIRNGWVADGTGNPLYPADVAISGDRIVEVGRVSEEATAGRVIDAAGKVVCPGFVDAHSHSDRSIHANTMAQSTIRQGITTEIVGNCGSSYAPLPGTSFGAYLDGLEATGISPNLASYIGHNTMRRATGVQGAEVTSDQIRVMQGMVQEAMEAGALGLSTGLEFDPGRLASMKEIVQLASVAGQYRGYYTSHIRNRDAGLQAAVDECLEVGRRAGTPVQVSHLNVRHNTGAAEGAWQRSADTVEAARRAGMDVMADMTPFREGMGSLTAILPQWFVVEGPARGAELLGDKTVRARLRNECDRYWRFIHRGEWDRVRVMNSAEFPEINGKPMDEIARLWEQDPWDCYFDLLAASLGRSSGLSGMALLFTDEHLAEVISHPLFSLAVDGWTSQIDGPLSQRSLHPLYFAGMVHYLTHHVRERHTLRLEEAIRKMTSLPATRFELQGRGLLRAGCFADVVVFDYDALDDGSTIEQPLAYCRGVEHVLVNGTAVVLGGEHTGARPGRALRRT